MRRGLFFSKSEKEEKVLDGVDGTGKSAYTDEAWAPAELLYEPPLLEVTQSQGSFCTIHTRFAAALLPDAIFDLLTDPNNHRVFKNIKEVVYRKILEDDGNRQYIELEQVGRWKFLFLSGSFATRIFLEQKRLEKTISFVLAKQGGMMRKFTGSWKIEPMKASEAETVEALHTDTRVAKASQTGSGDSGGAADPDPIVGSWVTFEQVVEPTIKPPWPLSNYIRGITEKIIRDMLADLQRECQRMSELPKITSSSSTSEIAAATPQTDSTPKVDTDGHDLKVFETV